MSRQLQVSFENVKRSLAALPSASPFGRQQASPSTSSDHLIQPSVATQSKSSTVFGGGGDITHVVASPSSTFTSSTDANVTGKSPVSKSKLLGVAKIEKSDISTTFCGGLIGSGSRFCIKSLVNDCHCGINSHGKKKISPEEDLFVILDGPSLNNSGSAYLYPAVSADNKDMPAEFKSLKSYQEWVQLFDAINNEEEEDANLDDLVCKVIDSHKVVESPKKSNVSFSMKPNVTKLDDVVPPGPKATSHTELQEKRIEALSNFSLKSLHMIEDDLKDKARDMEFLKFNVGYDKDYQTNLGYSSVWEALSKAFELIHEQQMELDSKTATVTRLSNRCNNLESQVEPAYKNLKASELTLKRHDEDIATNRETIESLSGVLLDENGLAFQVNRMQAAISDLRTTRATGSMRDLTLEASSELEKLKENVAMQLSKMDARIGNGCAIFDDVCFRSQLDCEEFVAEHFPNGTWEYIFDAHSYLDNIAIEHSSLASMLSELHQSSRVELSKSEAIIVNSFKNELPHLFVHGRVSGSGSTPTNSSLPLPGVQDYKNYTSHASAEAGVKGCIKTNGSTMTKSFRKEIPRRVKSDKGKFLCLNFLNRCEVFANTFFCTFVDELYSELRSASSASTSQKESWLLVASVIRSVFSYFREVRSEAQGAESLGMYGTKQEQCGLILWATAQCQMRMQELMDKNFRDHPVVACAMNYHMVKNKVSVSIYDQLVLKLDSAEKTIVSLKSDLKSVTGKVAKIENTKKSGGGKKRKSDDDEE